MSACSAEAALFLGAFFDELTRWGVREIVISPGSRSTGLAVIAFEMSRRFPDRMQIYIDVDERGAAFFALGLAKSSGRPVGLICTSGTAVANYYPAVMEAETSRVPLVILSGDRPPRLQGLGAPQTVDQLKAYSDHVRAFRQMPLPAASTRDLSLARQAAREACLAALGPGADVPQGRDGHVLYSAEASGSTSTASEASGKAKDARVVAARGCRYMAGPVQLNFPFDEPLMPDLKAKGLFGFDQAGTTGFTADYATAVDNSNSVDDVATTDGAATVSAGAVANASAGALATSLCGCVRLGVHHELDSDALARVCTLLQGRRVLVLVGEGSCETTGEARELLVWARRFDLPLLADPLSGLRGFSDSYVIDNYDNACGNKICPTPDVVIRFGRYPISKRCVQWLAAVRPVNIVVDVEETRDYNSATDVFAACTPLAFVRSMMQSAKSTSDNEQQVFVQQWIDLNERARKLIGAVDQLSDVNLASDDSANHTSEYDVSMGVTSLEENATGRLPQNQETNADGADNVASSSAAEGAYVRALIELAPEGSCVFCANSMSIRAIDTFYCKQDKPLAVLCNRGLNGIDGTISTALGAAQHFTQTTFLTGDLAMLHDLNALAMQRELRMHHGRNDAASIVIVLLNNNGGGIFEMLPQKSDDGYFERLFLTPQDIRFADAARAFDVPHAAVAKVADFKDAYRSFLGKPGISMIEMTLPITGLTSRYIPFQGL